MKYSFLDKFKVVNFVLTRKNVKCVSREFGVFVQSEMKRKPFLDMILFNKTFEKNGYFDGSYIDS
ncbi:hypothetical protein HQ47_10630 [Porphyromonas macacae]|uniref:Uncharacterized protein n=1 Tax=Porphyromonas macacae TaxID=28115 RepID=A0A0A2E4M7_9PORP|nr:hypothetical protein HQ47_10630 [Porphyromonas macacae]